MRFLGVTKPWPAAKPVHYVFWYATVAHVLTHSVNLDSGPKSGFMNRCRTRAGFANEVRLQLCFPHSWQQNRFSPVCVFLWLVKLAYWENLFPHTWKRNGFSPVRVRMWLVKLQRSENLFSHIWQKRYYSSVCSLDWSSCQIGKTFFRTPGNRTDFLQCVRMWMVRVVDRVNRFPHSWQQNGFSPVCVRICLVKVVDRPNLFLHTWQQYGFSPVCVRLCLVKSLSNENGLPHSWQWYGFSPVCVRMCLIK